MADIPIVVFNTLYSGMTMTHDIMARITKNPNVCDLKNAIKNSQHTIPEMDMYGAEIVLSKLLEDQLLEVTVQHRQQVLMVLTSVI